MLTEHLLAPDSVTPLWSTMWIAYGSVYALGLLAALVFGFLGFYARRWAPGRTYRFSLVTATVFVLFLAALALVDSSVRTDTTALILGMVVVAAGFRGPGRFHISVIVVVLLLFLGLHYLLWSRLTPSTIAGATIAAAFGVYLALSLESQRIETFLTQGELLQQNRTLAHLSATDPLTGVLNRRTMNDHLAIYFDKYKRYGARCSLIMVDVDHFKAVNDRYGHAAGDEVLIEVARNLTSGLRISDEIARYGGEEFAIILPHTRLRTALEAAERIRSGMERTEFSTQKLKVTASFGVSEIIAEDSLPTEVLRRADIALYRAKEGGRNQVVPYESGLAPSVSTA